MKFVTLTILALVATTVAWSAPKGNSGFDLGRQQFESGNYARALGLFDRVIERPKSRSERVQAYYYQGLSLYELGLFYSSYLSFRNVLLAADRGNKQVYEKAIKNAVLITEKLGMVERVGKTLTRLPPELIPSSVNHFVHYAQGVYFGRVGKTEQALSELKSVHPQSPFHKKALFHLGVLSTKKKAYKDSIYYFRKVIEGTSLREADFNLRELAKLNLARTVYTMGDMENSIKLYANFTSKSPYWVTILLEASWPLMRVSDTTVSLGNLHTVMSPFYREELVGEAYILRSTILFALCKYEEMRRTLAQFFDIYDPVLRAMQTEKNGLKSSMDYYDAYAVKKNMNRSFTALIDRDPGIIAMLAAQERLREERVALSQYTGNNQLRKVQSILDKTIKSMSAEIGIILRSLHLRKLDELVQQREQASYLKVEIVTGEKDLIENQKGLPPKRVTDVETSVSESYQFWPFVNGEYWEDELGSYVYTTESACVN